jgi:hypothetical protein
MSERKISKPSDKPLSTVAAVPTATAAATLIPVDPGGGLESLTVIGADPVGANTIYAALLLDLDSWYEMTPGEVETFAGSKYRVGADNTAAVLNTFKSHRTLLAITANTPKTLYDRGSDKHFVMLETS